MEKGSALIHAPFFLQVIYSKNHGNHCDDSIASSYSFTWFIEFFFSLLYI